MGVGARERSQDLDGIVGVEGQIRELAERFQREPDLPSGGEGKEASRDGRLDAEARDDVSAPARATSARGPSGRRRYRARPRAEKRYRLAVEVAGADDPIKRVLHHAGDCAVRSARRGAADKSAHRACLGTRPEVAAARAGPSVAVARRVSRVLHSPRRPTRRGFAHEAFLAPDRRDVPWL
jgi:hypothetical protein